jgi:hypothetical protein
MIRGCGGRGMYHPEVRLRYSLNTEFKSQILKGRDRLGDREGRKFVT